MKRGYRPKSRGASAYASQVAAKIAARHEMLRDAIGVKNIAMIVQEAFEEYGIVQRLATRIAEPKTGLHFDVYEGYSPQLRKFAEDMDLWTLENVIVRVMTDLDHRRRKYLGGYEAMRKGPVE
jgi:hypothetical protein